MNFSGVTVVNGQAVMVHYNPGWGEPGEWYLSFDNKTQLTIDDYSGMGNQEEYLNRLSADKYRDAIIDSNWERVGNLDDVIRLVLDYVGYNDDSRAEDFAKAEFQLKKLREAIQAVNTGLEADEVSMKLIEKSVNTIELVFKDIKEYVENCYHRIRVYNDLKSGEKVGASWTNESFLRDFPDSKYVPQIKKALEAS